MLQEQHMNSRQPIIVVVDPDADRATALSSRLDRRGYHVVRRSYGIDALQCVAEYRPDLVLSAARLPDIESSELQLSIREISPSTQVLFMTGDAGRPAAGDGIESAVDRLLERLPVATS
jgi:DNA-binding NtrC family response regulator